MSAARGRGAARPAADARPATVTVVDGVDYEVEPAEVFGIAGESGSGKTMSMLALLGLLPEGAAVEGTARFGDATCSRCPRKRLRAISGPRDRDGLPGPVTSLHPMLSIGRQLTEHVRLHLGLDEGGADERAVELLDDVRIPDPRAALRARTRTSSPAGCASGSRSRSRSPAGRGS